MTTDAPGLSGRVLVIDDEESLRTTLGAFLREEGCEVTVAADYREAEAAFEAAAFDLVLSDIILPGKNGIDVLERVREKDPGCPVVMLTGEPTLETATEAVRLGAFDYLAKPVRRERVVRVARQALTHRAIVLQNRQLERENREHQERLQQRVEEQTREIRAIAEIGRIIGSTLDVDLVYEPFAEEVRRLIPFDWIAINTIDFEQGTATLAFALDTEAMGRQRGKPWPLEGTHTEAVARTRMGTVVSGESAESLRRRLPGAGPTIDVGLRSSLMVPLISEGSAIGVLSLGSKEPDVYSDHDLGLARRVGDRIAGAIANARLHGALEVEAEERRLSESRHRGFVEALPDVLFRVSASGTFLDFSPGRNVDPVMPLESFLGRRIEDVLPPDVARLLKDGIRAAIDRREPAEREYKLSVDGEECNYEARLVAVGDDEVVAVIRDITERRQSERELERLATTDPLTGLLNRRQMHAILDGAVRSVVRKGDQGSLIYLDLDGLKLVNDTHGHAVGDELLRAIGEGLRSGIRATDAATRTGGDEFIIVLPHSDSETALERANQLARRVSGIRVAANGESTGVTCSAGVVTFPVQGASTDDLIVFADVAMYQAKESGGDRAVVYDAAAGGREALTAMQRARSMIIAALEHNRLHLVRQPIVRVKDRQPALYEVLVRLEDEDGTIRRPAEFIPQAETLGLVERIDRRVIEAACERWRRYADVGKESLLSVNMSPMSLGDEMLRFIDEQVGKWRVDRRALTVEITETAVTRGGVPTEAFVRGLRDRGFKVAMDDFGSGSTSFRLMRDLQFDYVKLDGSLIRNLATDVLDRDFVRAAVGVARAADAEVIAEHVQDDETMEFLAECGVEYAQGYHLGEPEEFPLQPPGTKAA